MVSSEEYILKVLIIRSFEKNMRYRNIFVKKEPKTDFSIKISKPENERFFSTGKFHPIFNNCILRYNPQFHF